MDKPGGGGPALAAAGRGNVAYSNVSGNGGVNEQESEHAQMTAMTAVEALVGRAFLVGGLACDGVQEHDERGRNT